jgi:hypothetical protein
MGDGEPSASDKTWRIVRYSPLSDRKTCAKCPRRDIKQRPSSLVRHGGLARCSEAIVSVVECDVPRHSAMGKDLIEQADFCDAYRAPLSRADRGVVEIFFAIFGRRHGW